MLLAGMSTLNTEITCVLVCHIPLDEDYRSELQQRNVLHRFKRQNRRYHRSWLPRGGKSSVHLRRLHSKRLRLPRRILRARPIRLALARLEISVPPKPRSTKPIPTSHKIWITAARLREQQDGDVKSVNIVTAFGVKQLNKHHVLRPNNRTYARALHAPRPRLAAPALSPEYQIAAGTSGALDMARYTGTPPVPLENRIPNSHRITPTIPRISTFHHKQQLVIHGIACIP